MRREVRGKGEKRQRRGELTKTHPRTPWEGRPETPERGKERRVRDIPRQKPSGEVRGGRHSHHDFSWC